MSKNLATFPNPENLPVEAVTLSVRDAGVVREVKALDPFWVENRQLTLYERPPSGSSIVLGALDAWKTKTDLYLTDLKWLLTLEYHRFWSTVLYHQQCMDTLVSFLQEASPPYLPPHENREVQRLYEDVRRLVLIVFSRLVTNKETKSCWMTKEYMGEILYEKFIFTIPIIWDICIAYGVDNSRHVGRILDSVFTLQPRYEHDALAAVAFVHEAFKFIILQVNNNYDSIDPPNLPDTFKGFSEIHRPSTSKAKTKDPLTFNVLKDLTVHLLDTAMTLRIFLEVYPKAVTIFRKSNFVISIAQLYEYGIPQLYEKLSEIGDKTTKTFIEVESYIDTARAELIDIFREMLAYYKNAIFSGEGSIESQVEEYLAVMMDCLSERLLIRDYHACYPVHEDIEMLRQAYPDIDSVKTDFILQAVYSDIDETPPQTTTTITNGHLETTDNTQTLNTTDHRTNTNIPQSKEIIPDKVREESLISEVKDILPHLGDGFILKCLQHYGFNAERVINSVLEDNLDPPLRALDRSLPIIPEDILDKKYLETGIQRLNIFDGDRFDIMTRDDVDVTNIHRGKRRENLKNLLDDKTEIKKRIDIYSKYNLVCEDAAMYSDEYDDTYDSEGGAPATPDELETRRPFVTPRVFAQHNRDGQEESESEESDAPEDSSSAPSTSNKRVEFCSNPEEIRARREANFQARRGKGHRPVPQPRNADVTGKPKGQGQEKEVLNNRDRKEKHKSSRANHNRRQGAQWKRTQGMMPS